MNMNESPILLSSAYWAPVEYYTKICSGAPVWVDVHEHYVKQTYRNRCVIATAGGLQALTVPVMKFATDKCPMKDVRISDHGNWRHVHWNALESAYRNSPFFEYYADDILPFYTHRWEFLVDFNEAIQAKVCELIDLHPDVSRTSAFGVAGVDGLCAADCRSIVNAKEQFGAVTRPYYQVFREKYGFQPNLSIADLLFNMGPESLLVLQDACGRK